MTKEVLQNRLYKQLEENVLNSSLGDIIHLIKRYYTITIHHTRCLFCTILSVSVMLHMADMTSYVPNAKVATG